MKKEEIKVVCTYNAKGDIENIFTEVFRGYVNLVIADKYEIIQKYEKNNTCMGESDVF